MRRIVVAAIALLLASCATAPSRPPDSFDPLLGRWVGFVRWYAGMSTATTNDLTLVIVSVERRGTGGIARARLTEVRRGRTLYADRPVTLTVELTGSAIAVTLAPVRQLGFTVYLRGDWSDSLVGYAQPNQLDLQGTVHHTNDIRLERQPL